MSADRKVPVTPLQFDLVDLPEEGLILEGAVTAEELQLDSEERRVYTRPITYRLKLTGINSMHDLLVQGSASTGAEVYCDRCDEPFEWILETDDICHEYPNAFGRAVDLTEDIREDILMAFPQHFVCSDDCRGLCPTCGQNLNEGDCDCESEEVEGDEPSANPWAGLDGLDLK